MRPRLLLAVDRRGWAFDNIAEQIQRRLVSTWDIEIANYRDLTRGSWDVVVAFWWPATIHLRGNLKIGNMITCVYDHHTWNATPTVAHQFRLACNQADVVAVANDRLVREIGNIGKPVALVEDGVDCDRFTLAPLPATFTAGWCGNSTRFASERPDPKGLGLIREACERAGVPLRVCDVATQPAIPHDRMPAWYRDVSVYVCASDAEGTPNPVLEAMATGRPVVTTDVGIVRKLVADDVNGRIVPRTVEGIAAALADLRARGGAFAGVGARAREAAEQHDWAHKIEAWRDVIERTPQVDRGQHAPVAPPPVRWPLPAAPPDPPPRRAPMQAPPEAPIDRSVQPGPLEASLYVTGRCNALCEFGGVPCKRQSEAGINRSGDMTPATAREIMERFPTLRAVCIAGFGEPLLVRDLGKIIGAAVERHLFVGLVTNGLLLLARRSEIATWGLGYLSVSLNATSAAEHQKVLGVARWQDVIDGIRRLREDRPQLSFGVSFVVGRETLPRLPEMVRFAHGLGCSFINFHNVLPHDGPRAIGFLASVIRDDDEQAASIIAEAQAMPEAATVTAWPVPVPRSAKPPRCLSPFMSIGVDAAGNVSACRRVQEPRPEFGTIRDTEIWTGKHFTRYRDELTTGPASETCRACFGNVIG